MRIKSRHVLHAPSPISTSTWVIQETHSTPASPTLNSGYNQSDHEVPWKPFSVVFRCFVNLLFREPYIYKIVQYTVKIWSAIFFPFLDELELKFFFEKTEKEWICLLEFLTLSKEETLSFVEAATKEIQKYQKISSKISLEDGINDKVDEPASKKLCSNSITSNKSANEVVKEPTDESTIKINNLKKQSLETNQS